MNNLLWYKNLNKSSITPANYIFSIVWSILYFLMFISFLIIVQNKECNPYCLGIVYFMIQFSLNLMWTTVFFRYKMIKLSLFLIFLIFLFGSFTYLNFYKINKFAGYLLIPYLLWLLLAFYMNLYIVIYN